MLFSHTISELQTKLARKETTVRELVLEAYERIEQLEPKLHAYITVRNKDEVLKEADALDRSPLRGPLHGIPFSVKDAYVTKDVRTTAGSKLLDTFIPPYQAEVVRRLLDAGAILVGKDSMDAWGHGGSSENTDYEPPRNPYDTERISGGSSGGSAVAVRAGMVMFSIGEDTGGSIRNPASMCNVTGLKVTYGRVSRYGAIAYASSLDSVGPIGKCVEDVALVLGVIAGADPKDATSSRREVPKYGELLLKPIQGVRIGVPKEFFADGLDASVKTIAEEATRVFTSLGATLVPVSLPSLSYAVSIYYLLAMSETSSNLARYDGVRFGTDRSAFTPETMRRILVGTYALKAGYYDELYKRALRGRTVLVNEFDALWKQCDVLFGPTVPVPPYKHGEAIKDPIKSYLADSFTAPVNLVGSPSLALPAGFTAGGLPVGIQLIGKKFDEVSLLALGYAFQKATEWHLKKPNILI